jgi:hypothetical protein
MHCLLLGNGLNRLSMPLSWHELLEQLASELGLAGSVAVDDRKPLSLHFEELCIRLADYDKARDAENAVKRRIAKLIGAFPVHRLHRDLACLFQVILTTNYDFTIEDALAGGLRERFTNLPESRYSLFRRVNVGARSIWHIHGDADRPPSILLGYDHYAGYLQKIRNYLTDGVPTEARIGHFRSPLRSGLHDFEKYDIHSWVDFFLRDHVHAVGFGFDFTEMDLWWLLVHKRRRQVRTGKTFVYLIDLDGSVREREKVKLSLFDSLGATAVIVRAESYQDGYAKIVEVVAENIASNTSWLPHQASPAPMTEVNAIERFMLQPTTPSVQLALTLKRPRR